MLSAMKETVYIRWFVVLAALLTGAVGRGAGGAETLKIEVRETAGIRRFGYPVAVKLPDVSLGDAKPQLRLRESGQPVTAQFRQEEAESGAGAWWLDFSLNMTPNEVRMLTLEYGPDIAADKEPHGLELKPTADAFEIRNGSQLTWTTGRNLFEPLKSVAAGDLNYLRSEGVRLSLEGPAGRDPSGGAMARPRVIRSGPLAVAIRYEHAPSSGPLAGVHSIADLTFPVSKSWVQVDWQIDDPRQTVRSVRAEIAQQLAAPTDDEPTLADFGAASLVYMSLTPGDRGALQAAAKAADPNGPMQSSWQVLRGEKDRLQPFVVQPAGRGPAEAEGWAHIMDRQRCLALGVEEFGDADADSIEIAAEGDVTLARQFGSGGQARLAKRLRFWLHFVGFPPHVTAATSPQSMLSPLAVRISRP